MIVGQVGDGFTELGPAGARRYGLSHGLPDETINTVAQDRDGNIWLGTDLGGVVRLARDGFVSYGYADGLGHSWARSILEDEAGELYVVSGDLVVNRWDGRAFQSVSRSEARREPGRHMRAAALRDRHGEWWLATTDGLLRFARLARFEHLARARPRAAYTRDDGLAGMQVHQMLEDARGDLWLLAADATPGTLTRWLRGEERFRVSVVSADGSQRRVTALVERAPGELWAGFDDGRLARFDGERWLLLEPTPGLGAVWSLVPGQRGRLWIVHGRGLAVMEPNGPRAPPPVPFAPHLAGSSVRCLLDEGERVFVGTTRGLQLLGPDGRLVRRFTRTNGLPNDEVFTAHRDRGGRLWFGTLDGVARLTSSPATMAAPRALISAVPLHYQHRLGSEQAWSAPQPQRQVILTGLAPGTYRFEVRSVDPRGSMAAVPAVVSFRVVPPWWRRREVLAVGALASDLHDDIGANLSQIAVLSEVARARSANGEEVGESLELIGQTARSSVDSIGDIVWAVDPARDSLEALAQRLRRVAGELCAGRDVELAFSGPSADLPLATDPRRELFLVFKEAVSNALRHSGCRRLAAALTLEDSRLVVQITDDGCGVPEGRKRRATGYGTCGGGRRASGASYGSPAVRKAGRASPWRCPGAPGARLRGVP